MTYYSVLDVTPTSEDWIPAYIGPTNALVAKHGGKYLTRTSSRPASLSSCDIAKLQRPVWSDTAGSVGASACSIFRAVPHQDLRASCS
jgi:hypothetical protein